MSVDLNVANQDRLIEAIKALGLKTEEIGNTLRVRTPAGWIDIANGEAIYRNAKAQQWVNKIKQSYSAQTVKAVAAKYKFNVIAKGNKLTLRRY